MHPSDWIGGKALAKLGAVARYVGARLGTVTTSEGDTIEIDVTLETTPSVLYDTVVMPAGKAAAKALGNIGQAAEFLKDQYRHCKLVLAGARSYLRMPAFPRHCRLANPIRAC